MAKSDVSRMEGSPWHVDYLKMDEWDSRRDKRACAYFYQNHCKIHNERCIGSSHCSEYKIPIGTPSLDHQEAADYLFDEVQLNDVVAITCKQTKDTFRFAIPNGDLKDMAPIKAQCIGKHLHDIVSWNGYQYEIIQLEKK